jgi:hypothetical protein
VWPSVYHDTGQPYRWYGPDDQLSDRIPSPDDFAELTPQQHAAWLEGLRDGATEAGPVAAPHTAGEVLLANLSQDMRAACPKLHGAKAKAAEVLEEILDHGTRHPTVRDRVHHFVMEAAFGHAGFGEAVAESRVMDPPGLRSARRTHLAPRVLLAGRRRRAAAAIRARRARPDRALVRRVVSSFAVLCGTLPYACSTAGLTGRRS